MKTKTCRACNETRSLKPTSWYKGPTCNRCWMKDYRKRTNYRINKDDTRKSSLKCLYGLTVAQYSDLLRAQGYRCLICDRHQDEFKKALAVDHCHSSGKVRGLLCSGCNLGLGNFRESRPTILKAVEYLEARQ